MTEHLRRFYTPQYQIDLKWDNNDGYFEIVATDQTTNRHYLELAAKVKQWLNSEENDWLINPPELTDDDDPLSWSIETHKVAKDKA